jgi:hypothetical protein
MRFGRLLAASALGVLAGACSASGHRTGGPAASSKPTTAAASTTTAPPVSAISASPASWSLPDAVSRAVVLADGGSFVVLGGLATGDTSTSRIVQVDPSTGRSQLAGTLAVAVHDSAGAVIGGRCLVFGGGSYATLSVVQAWTGGSAGELAHLPQPRSDLSAATLGATTYVIGGFDGTAMTPDVLATTDGQSFRAVARLAVGVRYAAVAAAGRFLWVMGGVTTTSEGGTTETDVIQKVDPATGQVEVAGRLPAPMGHATAVVLGGQIFVLGGRSGTVPSAAIWRLDQGTGAVVAAGHLPEPVSDAGSVVVAGVGYLVGGELTGPDHPLDSVVVLHASTRM